MSLEAQISLLKTDWREIIFNWIKNKGVNDSEMLKTFNCGIGFCLIAPSKNLIQIQKYFSNNYKPYVIGKITKGNNKIKTNGKINWHK